MQVAEVTLLNGEGDISIEMDLYHKKSPFILNGLFLLIVHFLDHFRHIGYINGFVSAGI